MMGTGTMFEGLTFNHRPSEDSITLSGNEAQVYDHCSHNFTVFSYTA